MEKHVARFDGCAGVGLRNARIQGKDSLFAFRRVQNEQLFKGAQSGMPP